ncbi:MAG: hypothetical protein A3E01_16220 [Gammaproteobacteria bacterium RIFCSPHIGHO2_12_FULL_63_22]|nr:MAG: hypothetical protein A3E01_16220 [Gammaproteobacteria bacterium RIFCSPHIGHO2_12_FULL_63_22]
MLASLALVGSCLVSATALAQTTTPTPTTTSTFPATAAPTAAAPAAARPAAARPAPTPADGQAATPDQLFTAWDTDKNKTLTLLEFKNGWESAREQNIMGRLETQFRAADKDKSGLIEAAEFANLPLIKRAGSGAPPMSAFDANKDQRLDFKEYLDLVPAMLKRLAPAKK